MDFLVNEIIRNLDKKEINNRQNDKKLATIKLKSTPKDDKKRCC